MRESSKQNLSINSTNWGFVKVTIPNPASAQSPESLQCKTCKMYKLSGTGVFVAPSNADANAIPLPSSLAEAFTLPIDNLNQLSFFGTAGDVVMVIWRS